MVSESPFVTMPTAEWLGKFHDELSKAGFAPVESWELTVIAFHEYARAREGSITIKGAVDA